VYNINCLAVTRRYIVHQLSSVRLRIIAAWLLQLTVLSSSIQPLRCWMEDEKTVSCNSQARLCNVWIMHYLSKPTSWHRHGFVVVCDRVKSCSFQAVMPSSNLRLIGLRDETPTVSSRRRRRCELGIKLATSWSDSSVYNLCVRQSWTRIGFIHGLDWIGSDDFIYC